VYTRTALAGLAYKYVGVLPKQVITKQGNTIQYTPKKKQTSFFKNKQAAS
jgi:hypothetical protein